MSKTAQTGYPNIDNHLDFNPGTFTLIGGFTSSGKTTLCANLAIGAAFTGNKVLLMSLEESNDSTASRLISNCTHVSFSHLLSPEHLSLLERRRLFSFREKESSEFSFLHRIQFQDDKPSTMEEFKAHLLSQKDDIDLVIIDHISYMPYEPDEKDYAEDQYIVIPRLQAIAKALEVPIIGTTHLPLLDDRQPHAPVTKDFIHFFEQDILPYTDNLISIYRPSLYSKDPSDALQFQFNILKNNKDSQMYSFQFDILPKYQILAEAGELSSDSDIPF